MPKLTSAHLALLALSAFERRVLVCGKKNVASLRPVEDYAPDPKLASNKILKRQRFFEGLENAPPFLQRCRLNPMHHQLAPGRFGSRVRSFAGLSSGPIASALKALSTHHRRMICQMKKWARCRAAITLVQQNHRSSESFLFCRRPSKPTLNSRHKLRVDLAIEPTERPMFRARS